MEVMKYDKPVKVLVTGGAGFIGSNLCKYLLEQGNEVVCLDNLSNGSLENIAEFQNNSNFSFIEDTITNFDVCLKATKNVDYVFHEAALGSVPRSMKFPLIYEENNVRGSSNIFEAARKNNVKRVIYASSSSVYGNDTNEWKKEYREGDLLSIYALSKKVVEYYARVYRDVFGLDTIGLRYFNVFGPKQKIDGPYAAVIPRFIINSLSGKQSEIHGDGTQSRDFTYIYNVIKANYLASMADKPCSGKVYNVGCGETHTVKELYQYISEKIDPRNIPKYVEARKGDIKNSQADLSNSSKELGYSPEYKIYEGLDKTIEWYKENTEREG